MNFFTWERKHGKQYADIVASGDISSMPAFKESSTTEISNAIADIIERRLTGGESIMELMPVICEYLYETYHISPVDVEILCQYVMLSTLKVSMDSAERAGKAIGKIILQGEDGTSENP